MHPLALIALEVPPQAPEVLSDFNPTALATLNLAGTFVFGLSGALAAVRARFDVFGIIVLAVVVGITGGIVRDLLIGIPPQTFRDTRYLAAGAAAGLITFMAHGILSRLERPILVLDAGGLAIFCVAGAATALENGLGPLEAVVLGAVTGVGGGMLRDLLVGQVPVVLRTGLHASPALIGAAVLVVPYELDHDSILFALLGAATCFAIRLAGIYWDISLPQADPHEDDPEPVGDQ